MKIIWSPLAITRINEIADYIAEDSPDTARKWVDEIFTKVERIEEFPLSGRFVPEIDRKDIREILFGNYRIIYKIFANEIHLLTVRHLKQRLPITEIKK
jgi:addiction module RelE/StbE family toxin